MNTKHSFTIDIIDLSTDTIGSHLAHCHTPIQALAEAHEVAQCRLGFAPHEYKIVGLHREGTVPYELPLNATNPDLWKMEKTPPVPPLEFAFVKDIPTDAHLAD